MQRFDVVPGRAFASLAAGPIEDRVLVEVVAGRLDRVVDVAAGGRAEATRNWISSAIGSDSVCGAVRATNSPATPCNAASRAGAGQLLIAGHPRRSSSSSRTRPCASASSSRKPAISSRWRWFSSSAARSRARSDASLARWRTGRRAGAAVWADRSASISARSSACCVEKRAADPRALGDRGERDRRALAVELAQRAADALLGIERAPGGRVSERRGLARAGITRPPSLGVGEVAQVQLDRRRRRASASIASSPSRIRGEALLVALEHLDQPHAVLLARLLEQLARSRPAAARARRGTSRR